MAVISRLQLDHPALATAGGTTLHTNIEAIYEKIGDNINTRFFSHENLAATASVDFIHNFNQPFDNLRAVLCSYNPSTGLVSALTEATSPKRSTFTVTQTAGDIYNSIRVTNNNVSQFSIALILSCDPVTLNDLFDVSVSGAEDGQALVYDAASNEWTAGASGDASFKVQSIVGDTATIKGGYFLLPDGREIGTYDGSGTSASDFKDISVNLTTVKGSAPADATSYYLYIDLDSLGAPITQTETGRVVYPVVQTNFELLTTTPESVNRKRYVPRAVIRSADSGNAWVGTGSDFATLATLLPSNDPTSDANYNRVTQTSHGFAVGDAIYYTGTAYAKAQADAANTSETVGVVSSVENANTFVYVSSGEIAGLSGLTAGTVYFLSADTAGLLTATEPTVIGEVSKPVLIATSTTGGLVLAMRGVVVGGSNARTVISLNDGGAGAATVQDVSAYDAGELSGWVYIDATTDVRFFVKAQFAKLGSGSDYSISYQTTGDVPPTGFDVAISAAGVISITTATSAITGFSSASINYALNVPAVGATFPLTVSTANVVGRTDGSTPSSGYVGEIINASLSNTALTSTVPSVFGTLSLTKGTYLICGHVYFDGVVSTAITIARASLSTSASEDFNNAAYMNGVSASDIQVPYVKLITLSSDTTYNLVVFADFSSSCTAITSRSRFYAIRIA